MNVSGKVIQVIELEGALMVVTSHHVRVLAIARLTRAIYVDFKMSIPSSVTPVPDGAMLGVKATRTVIVLLAQILHKLC